MRVAVINNGTSEPQKLLDLLKEASCEVFNYPEAGTIDTSTFDLLVLSGSSQFPIVHHEEKLKEEIALIKKSSIPILGICYGCELIAYSFGGTLKDRGDGSQERNAVRVEVVEDDPIFKGRKDFEVYDAHRWVIDTLPPSIKILARSVHGPEMIRHTSRPIYGFQFHPEKMLDETYGDELFDAFLKQQVI